MTERMKKIEGFHRRSNESQKDLLACFLTSVNIKPVIFIDDEE